MSLADIARRLQRMETILPKRLRLPLRYHVQSMLGALEPEMQLLPSLLSDATSAVALDVGANIGVYTYALARCGAKVHAFEPQPACGDTIEAWVGASGADVSLHRVAVGAEPGTLTLHVPIRNGIPVTTRASFETSSGDDLDVRVPVITLDGIGLDTVGFIKIDVEGFELQVLSGATDLIARSRPSLLVEIDRPRYNVDGFHAIVKLLADLGYRCHILANASSLVACDDPWRAPAATYNFIFLPASHLRERTGT